MKKMISVLLVMVIMFTLSGCSILKTDGQKYCNIALKFLDKRELRPPHIMEVSWEGKYSEPKKYSYQGTLYNLEFKDIITRICITYFDGSENSNLFVYIKSNNDCEVFSEVSEESARKYISSAGADYSKYSSMIYSYAYSEARNLNKEFLPTDAELSAWEKVDW